MMDHTPQPRRLLSKTPVMAVRANHRGICILGEDARYSRFVEYDKSLEAQNAKQKAPLRRRQQEQDALQLNPIQRSMYRRLMYGRAEYTAEQIAGMSPKDLDRVERDHKQCSRVLHRLKVDAYFEDENKLFNAIWPHLQLGSKPADYEVKLPGWATLNKLGIGTKKVVQALIERGLLPQNFLSLSVDTLEFR